MDDQFDAPCENCHEAVYFNFRGSGEIAHFGCDHAKVSMITHNPRRLGVVSSIPAPLYEQRWRLNED